MPDSRKARKSRAKPKVQTDRRKTTSTRISPELRARLDDEAEQSSRSLAQEIERRLEQSFAEEKSLSSIAAVAAGGVRDSFGKLETFLVARMLANAIQTIEAKTGKNWMDDPEAHRQTQEACKNILDAFCPPGGKGLMGMDMTIGETIGKDAAIKAIKTEFDQMAYPDEFFRTKKKAE